MEERKPRMESKGPRKQRKGKSAERVPRNLLGGGQGEHVSQAGLPAPPSGHVETVAYDSLGKDGANFAGKWMDLESI